MKHIPYTYLIYCIKTEQFYYGVRYSKNCHPDDLWKTYYTSSIYVHDLIRKYGKDSFLYQIRKTFTSSGKARKWEETILRRLKVKQRSDFINKSNSVCPSGANRMWVTNCKTNRFIDINDYDNYIGWSPGRTFSRNHKEKISKTRKSQGIVNIPNHSEYQKHKWSEMRKGKINGRDTSKSITVKGITYSRIKDASAATGLSRYILVNHYL